MNLQVSDYNCINNIRHSANGLYPVYWPNSKNLICRKMRSFAIDYVFLQEIFPGKSLFEISQFIYNKVNGLKEFGITIPEFSLVIEADSSIFEPGIPITKDCKASIAAVLEFIHGQSLQYWIEELSIKLTFRNLQASEKKMLLST